MKRRFIRTTIAFATVLAGALSLPSPASGQVQEGDRLPNLVAIPPSDIVVVKPTSSTAELRFTASSWNAGVGPLELRGGSGNGAGVYEALQVIYNPFEPGGYREISVGTFDLSDGHHHIHFQGYANYVLTPVSGTGRRESQKTSFCIMDTDKVNLRVPGAPKKPVYRFCGFDVQGMSIGWADKYGAYLEGQSIDMTGWGDGLYELTTEFNPQAKLLESSLSDNAACVRLNISVSAGTVQAAGACGATGSAVSITSVTPDSGFAGTVSNLTIAGTGFFPGIAVGFENGSGPAPVLDQIAVQDSNTISAVVTIKGGSRAGVWDLRVGSVVLPNAFTVQR